MPRFYQPFLILAFTAYLLGSFNVPPQDGPKDDHSKLAENLWKVARDTFGNTPITGDAAKACRTLIDHGASKVEDTAAAERDVKKFASEMVKDATFNEKTGSKQIDLAAYNKAYRSVCPLYPFC